MKTKEELNALKEEVETLNKKLHELTEEELAQVSGGLGFDHRLPQHSTSLSLSSLGPTPYVVPLSE